MAGSSSTVCLSSVTCVDGTEWPPADVSMVQRAFDSAVGVRHGPPIQRSLELTLQHSSSASRGRAGAARQLEQQHPASKAGSVKPAGSGTA